MKKIRTKKYLQLLKNKAVKDYFNDPNQSLKIIAEKPTIKEILHPYKIVDNISLPCPSVPKINLARPSSVHEGGVNASINDREDGSKGLYGVTSSTKKEQKKIINKIVDDTMAVGDLIKLW